MNGHPFSSVGTQKMDTKWTPQMDTPSPSVAWLKMDTPKGTGTNMYKNPHKER